MSASSSLDTAFGLGDQLSALVHPSAQDDGVALVRHRLFIAAHLLIGVVGFAAFPVYLLVGGPPSIEVGTLFGFSALPLLAALDLARSGNLARAHVLSAATATLLLVAVGVLIAPSPVYVLPWLVVVPLQAALSGSARVVRLAMLIAIAAAAGLGARAYATAGSAPDVVPAAAAAAAAALYAGLVALGYATVERQRQRATVAADLRYRLISSIDPDLITCHDSDGSVSFASPAAERLLGLSARELLGTGLFERVHVADRPAYLSAIAGAAAGERVAPVELRLRRETGEGGPVAFLWVEMSCRRGAGSEAPRVSALFRDIEERKLQQAVLAELERDSIPAERARNLAAAGSSLREPLRSIVRLSEGLADPTLPAEQGRLSAERIGRSALDVLEAVDRLVDFARLASGDYRSERGPVSIGEVLDRCRDELAGAAAAGGVQLQVAPVEPLPEVVGDAGALAKGLSVLGREAVALVGRGGEVKLSARREAAELVLSVVYLAPLGAEEAPAVDSEALWLPLGRALIELQGGTVAVESRSGRRGRFTVHLALGEAAATIDLSARRRLRELPAEALEDRIKRRA